MEQVDQDGPYAIPRLMKVPREGLAKCHAARAETGLDLPHLFRENPAPTVMFNAAPPGVTFVDYVIAAYKEAVEKKLVYRPRKDQILAIEGLLTASPEFFRPDTPDVPGKYRDDRVKSIRERVLPFLKTFFGKRLIRVEEQLDEVTPHWQFALLPIDKRGHWSAKNVMSRTLLIRLWDKWFEATKDLGLKRGHPRMIATHTVVREYYAAATKFEEMAVSAENTICVQPLVIQAPSRTALLNPKKLTEELNRSAKEWAKTETDRLNDEIKPLFAAVAGQKLKDRKAEENRRSAIKHSKANESAQAEISGLKERIFRLTPVDPRDVAMRLGLPGLPKNIQREDAIGVLSRLEGLSDDEALGWLVDQFGADQAASTLAERMKSEFLEHAQRLPRLKVLTNADVEALIDRQFDALRADAYEIVLAPNSGEPTKFVRYTGDEKAPKHWSNKRVLNEVPKLKQANGVNHVMLLPVSEEYAYYCVEGESAVEALRKEGVDACLGLRISAALDQAIIRLPLDEHHEKRTRKLAEICRRLGVKHQPVKEGAPILLAGFRFGRDGIKSPERSQKMESIEVCHALDITYLAGIEWAKAPRLGFIID
jgi:hypothetical protein